jgi:hypothetical protein
MEPLIRKVMAQQGLEILTEPRPMHHGRQYLELLQFRIDEVRGYNLKLKLIIDDVVGLCESKQDFSRENLRAVINERVDLDGSVLTPLVDAIFKAVKVPGV